MSKILIVDDEVQIRTLLARMMELEGYEVCQAGDCRAALKQLELQSPDVALCDVFLPDGNGVDLVLAIKKAAPNVEVILLTAHGNIPDGVQAIKNGAFDYITKGDDNNKIIPLISRAVEKAAMNALLLLHQLSVFQFRHQQVIDVCRAFDIQAGGEVFQFDECLRIVECGDGFLQIHIITFHQVTDYIGGYSFKEEFCGIRVHSRFSILIAASE